MSLIPSAERADHFCDHINYVVPYLELTQGVICCGINLVFCSRFIHQTRWHVNFRTLLVAHNFIIGLLAVLHPLPIILPFHERPAENGATVEAIIFYFLHFLTHIATACAHIKFMLFSIERWLAFRRRKTYEQEGRTVAVTFILLIMLAKAYIILEYGTDVSIHQKLMKILTVEYSKEYFAVCYVLVFISSTAGIAQLCILSLQAPKMCYSGKTLSENFEIRQTAAITKMMSPMLTGYIITGTVTAATTSIYFVAQAVFPGNTRLNEKVYIACTTVDYFIISCYNMVTTLYMVELARRKANSVYFISGLPEKSDQEQMNHFAALAKAWE